MYKTLHTYQYTSKVTVKDFILGQIAGHQLTTFLKNVLLQFFRNSFGRKFFE